MSKLRTGVINKRTKYYRFRSSLLLRKQILQVCIFYQDWDFKTKKNVGPEYFKWHDVDKNEALDFLYTRTI